MTGPLMRGNWYHSKDRTERHGPVSTDELRDMIRRGALPPDTLVWREGMTDWASAAEQPELQSTEPSTQPAAGSIPANFGGWLRFVGITSIGIGVLYCASCIGVLWGILLIVAGTSLLGARSALDQISDVPAPFIPFLHKLNTFFVVTGLTYIIILAGAALVLIFYGGFMIAALSNLN